MSTPGGFPVEPNASPEPDVSGVPAPPPPPGPGVTPPFTSPPTDRNRRGLWIGLGVGALVLVLCCVGGLTGFGLLLVGTNKQVQTGATQVVRGYLHALETGDYDTAYSYLCSDVKGKVTATEFAAGQEARPRVTRYQVHKPQIGNVIVVPADVTYENGTSVRRSFELRQESGGQELRICRGL